VCSSDLVQAGDPGSLNVTLDTLVRNGADVTGPDGNPAVLEVSGTSDSTNDTAQPTITAITANVGPHVTNDVITITLDANEDLLQSGNPTLDLDIGGDAKTATFSTINAGDAEFTYTVVSGVQDTDGFEVTGINAASGELTDAAGNDLDTGSIALPIDTEELVNPPPLVELGSVSSANLGAARTVAVEGNFAYVTAFDADALTVVDISDPDNPVERGSVSSTNLNGAFGVAVDGNFAYVTAREADALTVVKVNLP